jgi:hypothetical protein
MKKILVFLVALALATLSIGAQSTYAVDNKQSTLTLRFETPRFPESASEKAVVALTDATKTYSENLTTISNQINTLQRGLDVVANKEAETKLSYYASKYNKTSGDILKAVKRNNLIFILSLIIPLCLMIDRWLWIYRKKRDLVINEFLMISFALILIGGATFLILYFGATHCFNEDYTLLKDLKAFL